MTKIHISNAWISYCCISVVPAVGVGGAWHRNTYYSKVDKKEMIRKRYNRKRAKARSQIHNT